MFPDYLARIAVIAALVIACGSAFAEPTVEESIATRTVFFSSKSGQFSVGIYCARGHDATLRGFLHSNIPVDQGVDYTVGSRLDDERNLVITGYGFSGANLSVVDVEDQVRFLELLTRLPSIKVWEKEYGNPAPERLVDEIDLNGSSLALAAGCGA